jgi:hypothetical protein
MSINNRLLGKTFKTMAQTRNFVEGVNIYTSKIGNPHYYGRGKGNLGNGGFFDKMGFYNQFVYIDKNDCSWKNEVHGGIWLETAIHDNLEDKKNWIENRASDIKETRVFLKENGKDYTYIGVFKLAFKDKAKFTCVWKKIND